jgi:hypothetical protein
VDLLHRREFEYHSAREVELPIHIFARLQELEEVTMTPADVAEMWGMWLGAGEYRHPQELRRAVARARAESPLAVWVEWDLLPWQELEDVLERLPTDL